MEVSPDRRRVSLALDELVPGFVYQLELNGLRADDGTEATHPLYYTLNRLKG